MTSTTIPERHYAPKKLGDRIAYAFTGFLRRLAGASFGRRYGHRAVVLETVAAVRGMISDSSPRWRALRRMKNGHGWIRTVSDNARSERSRMMTFVHVARPSPVDRLLVRIIQGVYCASFLLLYVLSPTTGHRVVGYLEEEAVGSYTEYLSGVDEGTYRNVPAPKIARSYWSLAADAGLREVIIAVRANEARHRDVNHRLADALA